MKTRVLVLRTAGTNCDMETTFAFKSVGAEVDAAHINSLKSGEKRLADYHILAIPGGFTYGDDIASGKVLANELKYTLFGDMAEFLAQGKLIIGICNGFQVLVKAGLLPNIEGNMKIDSTLNLNDSARFEDRWVYLKKPKEKKKNSKCVWTDGVKDLIYLPIAHAEGKFIPKDKKTLEALKLNDQVVFRYSDEKGKPAKYPANPNGSAYDIAGLCDPTGRVLGMMPHPERFTRSTQHPRWTRERLKPEGDGLAIFRSGVKYVEKNLLSRRRTDTR